jgi:hypothetical protein
MDESAKTHTANYVWPRSLSSTGPEIFRAHGQSNPLSSGLIVRMMWVRHVSQAGELGRSVQAATADKFVANLMPVVRAIQNTGATTLEAITQALNQRGIRTARGAKWYASSVMNVLERGKTLCDVPALL